MGKILIPIVFILINILIDKKKADSKKKSDKKIDSDNLMDDKNKNSIKQKKKEKQNSVESLIGNLIESIKPHLSPEDQKKYSNKIENKKETQELLEKIQAERESIKNDKYEFAESQVHDEKVEINMKKEFTRDELVKAIVMKEILDKPVSLRES